MKYFHWLLQNYPCMFIMHKSYMHNIAACEGPILEHFRIMGSDVGLYIPQSDFTVHGGYFINNNIGIHVRDIYLGYILRF